MPAAPALNDVAWRRHIANETLPLDRPCPPVQRSSPISWHYGSEPSSRLGTAASALAPSRSSSCSSQRRLLRSSSSRAHSALRSAGASSIGSQAVRSSVLSMELESERGARVAAEQELAELRAQLAQLEGPGA
mmetsp:Transcript_64959/g.190039  ORF Transcript_64959/g.190039 Transcript_64959/m.190039 type:complete len:133 (+) Transcript_64959:70-468(+)